VLIATIITVALALVSAFFDKTEKDRRGPMGLPVLRPAGWVLFVLTLVSGGVALWKGSEASNESRALRDNVGMLNKQAGTLQEQNQKLQGDLGQDYNDLLIRLGTSIDKLNGLEGAADRAASELREETSGIRHFRLSEFPVTKIMLSWEWPTGSSPWRDFARVCPGYGTEGVTVGTVESPWGQTMCREDRGVGFTDFVAPTAPAKKTLDLLADLYLIGGLELSSDTSPARVKFDGLQKVWWSSSVHTAFVQVKDPGIALDWFDGRGMSIHTTLIDTERSSGFKPVTGRFRPTAFDVEIDTDREKIRQSITATWGLGQVTGPHPIKLPPEVLGRLEADRGTPSRQ
jgi:hypothetical protein